MRLRFLVASFLSSICFLHVGSIHVRAEQVLRVIDGDTFELTSGEKVRYIGIDTPETVHPQRPVEFMGKEAMEFNRLLVEGKTVVLEKDVGGRDRDGRILAYVFLDSIFVNAELVRFGFAMASTVPPNVRHADLFRSLQDEARRNNRGLWNDALRADWESNRDSVADGFYITRAGKKYHLKTCRHLSATAVQISEADAREKGYLPCAVCLGSKAIQSDVKAPVAEVKAGIKSGGASSRSNTSSSGGQCSATTKKGSRCKRNARAGSSYCWQHG